MAADYNITFAVHFLVPVLSMQCWVPMDFVYCLKFDVLDDKYHQIEPIHLAVHPKSCYLIQQHDFFCRQVHATRREWDTFVVQDQSSRWIHTGCAP